MAPLHLPVKLLNVLLEASPVALLNSRNDALSNLLHQLGVWVVSRQGLAPVLWLLQDLRGHQKSNVSTLALGCDSAACRMSCQHGAKECS